MDATDRDIELIEDFTNALLSEDWVTMADVMYITECRISEGNDDGE
jgi:hypothetical protein|tara:strand:- start:561 stop:698 length:138 start_codon:yes stop_codon:yes gene_type:complete